ncbi:MAG TPA: chromosomal replication initiator protein DnaA [Acidimicrobiales bacterium]|nr:chromosomal replication initiator protein DnaA [Acidimicrobiales bacterium]
MNEAAALWTVCAEALQHQVSEAAWQTWFAGLRPEQVADDHLVVSAPSVLVRDRIEERFKGLIESVLGERGGTTCKVRIDIRPPEAHLDDDEDDDFDDEVITPLSTGYAPGVDGDDTGAPPARPAGPRPDAPTLNPRYTFEAFVIGATNRFAHAAAMRVAEKPAASYNPLFIHGDSGLGKTHLLHAIGHYVAENFPQLAVRYVSTETFMNQFVDAIRTNGQSSFKRRYRDIDVLLVDDIQFMEGKEGLQEEFFHTFNSLYEGARQIVLSSDRHPRNIATLEDRLRSRFEWGLITDVQPPDLETRLAILRKKAETERVPIPADVLELIATHVKDNIRELEGALIRVSAYANLNAEPLTVPTAEKVLSDILDAGRPRQITPKVILEATSEMFDIPVDEICGTSRRRPLVNARQVGMYVFRELTDFSYPAIAREFGGRDHTTVIHAVEKIGRLMMEKRQVYDQVTELIHRIKGSTS